MFIHSKKNLAVLITDKNNRNFGKLGKIIKLKLNGNIVLKLSDEKEMELDYLNGCHIVKLFYRHSNKKGIKLDELRYGPRGLAQTYRDLGGQISEFVDDYITLFGKRPERLG